MFLKHIDLTTALRPSYLPDEVLLFVQDNVGLYEGKYKLPNHQNGQVYLTSHRICYVDKEDPRTHSAALDLKDVDRYEFYAGFLKSSAKITLIPKPLKRSSLISRASAMSPAIGRSGSQLDTAESVKISFRGGGEKIFHERLKNSMAQRKWLLQGAPPVPRSGRASSDNGALGQSPSGSAPERKKGVGIAGLEQRGLDMRKNNEVMIGSAFEDLDALMASAKEIVALAERFARQANGGSGAVASEANALLAESASQLGLITTKDIVGGSSSETLYLSELARNLAEFLTDDARGVLKKAGGILNLVDLWAMFNRARGGVELVSPMDFEKAAQMWESLKLPVRLRTFKSGVMVVQSRDRTDETTIKALRSWLADLHEFPPDREVAWDWRMFGRGVTARDAAERFGWSIGVAEEELEMAEERGVLCREEGIEGLKFWENFIDTGEGRKRRVKKQTTEDEQITRALKDAGFI
ncbi:hypothetical protein ACHAQH_007473 [Verticillium albo-atrum]